jgi:hypothetical protein
MTATDQERRGQLRAAALAYVRALEDKDFDLIPYAAQVQLRAPMAPGGVEQPLIGRERLRADWWTPLPGLLGRVEMVDLYVNEALTAVVIEARIEIRLDPPVWLRVADRFRLDDDGRIVDQVNHFDPRDVTDPGWRM